MSRALLPTTYQPNEHEPRIYAQWEESGAFKPENAPVIPGDVQPEPFSILMPPPNANASLHAGHAMFVIQDILARFKRMQGHPTVWIPGTDHAGFETQVVYEKHLKKSGQSRFNFDRETLYSQIEAFVKENSGLIIDQLRRMGFSADWSRLTFTLDPHVISTVYDTFQKLAGDGLVYRDRYLVNYCPKCGTTFADLEVDHEERTVPLVYVRYRFSDGEPRIINGQEIPYLVVATVRPETNFADTGVAIHPDDPRAEALKGEFVLNPLTRQPIPVVLDDAVDREFGTATLKVTPGHDQTDWQIGRRHGLPVVQTIDTMGKIDLTWLTPTEEPALTRAEQLKEQFHGMSVFHARTATVKLMEVENSIEKIDPTYRSNTLVCYKGKHEIEPLPLPNWFLKMKPLAELGLQAVRDGEVKIIPERFTKQYFEWLENIRDWPISRQIVWGIRIPVWYDTASYPELRVTFLDTFGERQTSSVAEALSAGQTLEQIKAGLQNVFAPIDAQYQISVESPGPTWIQETDTFDTWFSSGQWPLVTLKYPDGADFQQFYPTSVLDTMWDILFFWVARMVMLGKYLTQSDANPQGLSPFKTVYLHSMVTDSKGAKMSKSKGNVVNPLEFVEKYGADALRMALVAGAAPGNPISLSEPKVKGYRNFANKIWNIGRFVQMKRQELSESGTEVITIEAGRASDALALTPEDDAILKLLQQKIGEVTDNLNAYRFSDATLGLYDFLWNDFANGYLERNKARALEGADKADSAVYVAVVEHVLFTGLRLLHPFMPFVTEALWETLRSDDSVLITSAWPL
jgi:valyl-tRNA synthetase